MNLEVQFIAVSDVERLKQFYQRLGWSLGEEVGAAKNSCRRIGPRAIPISIENY
jgi:hypothetical protein